jgi:hypothetical protein
MLIDQFNKETADGHPNRGSARKPTKNKYLVFLQWRCLYCKLKRLDIFTSKESSHRQTNKVKILAPLGLPIGRDSILTVFTV